MPTKFQLLTIAAAIGFIGLIAVCAWFWRRKSQVELKAKITQEAGEEPKYLLVDAETPPKANPQVESPTRSGTADLDELTTQIVDPVLRDYLVEIANTVSKAGPVFDSETPLSFIEEMVDRSDDLAAMAQNHDEKSKAALVSFRKVIVRILSACGAELIHSSTWDPAIQRAVAKEPTEGIESPTILRFGSTGIRRHSELLRKQEVVLAVPI
jgi:hypothetical protein